MEPERPSLSFDRFTIDFRRRLLLADGKPAPLDAKAFDLLVYLIDHRAEPTSRDRILKDVWPGKTVSESNLNVQLSALRIVLRKAGCPDQLILTSPGPCYRFIGAVRSSGEDEEKVTPAPPLPEEPSPSKRRLWWISLTSLFALILLVSAAILLPLALHPSARAEPAIVVVPFRNLSDGDSQKELPDAITDDLTTDLAHFPGLSVIARGTADTFRGTTLSAHDIGKKLHARYLLEGSIRAEETSYRINAQLIDTDNNVHLWAERFDTPKDHLADVQEVIVRRIASALHIQIDHFESERSFRDRPDDPSSIDLFFRARAVLDADDSLAGFTRAQALLEEAISKEPSFADALAELGWMLLRKVTTLDDPDGDRDYAEAKAIISRALASSPRNALALAARARQRMADGQCAQAIPDAEAALAIEPSGADARTVLAACAQADGRLDDAANLYEEILRLDPESALKRSRYLALGYIRLVEGHPSEAITLLNKAVAIDDDKAGATETMGRNEQAKLMLIAAYGLNGEIKKAQTIYKTYNERWPRRTVWRIGTYLPKKWLQLAGVKQVLATLRQAGMPEYADEHAYDSSGTFSCSPGDFAATPRSLPGGKTMDTALTLKKLHDEAKTLVIDVGRGAAVMQGAKWYDGGATSDSSPTAFAFSEVKRNASVKASPIIVVGDGPSGCLSFLVAEDLIEKGFSDVAWYRGGEEAWFASNQISDDRRP